MWATKFPLLLLLVTVAASDDDDDYAWWKRPSPKAAPASPPVPAPPPPPPPPSPTKSAPASAKSRGTDVTVWQDPGTLIDQLLHAFHATQLALQTELDHRHRIVHRWYADWPWLRLLIVVVCAVALVTLLGRCLRLWTPQLAVTEPAKTRRHIVVR